MTYADFRVLDNYTLCVIILLQFLLYIPIIDTYILYILFMLAFLVYYVDNEYIIKLFNKRHVFGLKRKATESHVVYEIHEVTDSTTKHNRIKANELIFVAKNLNNIDIN